MPNANLQELLAQEETYSQWFDVNEKLPLHLMKRNLKLIRGLSGSSKMTLKELDQLTEQDIQEVLLASRKRQERNATPTPKTPAEFFYASMTQSPYFSEIIPYSGNLFQNTPQPKIAGASKFADANILSNNREERVHGFHLNESEAFSSTSLFFGR